jgi:hypothetical protein
MPCSHTRKDVSRIVLEVIRHIHQDQSIVEASVFGPQGINADAMFRSTYFFPIKVSVEKIDCVLRKFSPADCENAESVGDIVDAVFDDLSSPAVTAVMMSAAPSDDARTRKTRKSRKASKARGPKTKKR